jgi:hypothetical protein
MPVVKLMEAAEITALQHKSSGNGQRAAVAHEYDQLLQPYDVGSFCTVDLAEDEVSQKQTIRNRLAAAGERRGVALHFIRTAGPLLRFEVRAKGQGEDQVLDMFGPAKEDPENLIDINDPQLLPRSPKRPVKAEEVTA